MKPRLGAGPPSGPKQFVDTLRLPRDHRDMDMDELFARRPEDPLAQLVKQDLDPLSVNELRERVAILQAEIARVNLKIEGAVNFRANADSLFKR